MKESVLTVRIDKKLKKELEALERARLSTASDVVREALFEYLQREESPLRIW
ncbi:MAG: ribbon-helix-helix protein, CopG family [Candidatus Diapherotrites archaeon]|nr:ribbon-helix-helix protein, CopG family [Candidatus Diapherotrites archaeon]